jgi:3-oxoacyl-(acyl-carrier-protein) synthase
MGRSPKPCSYLYKPWHRLQPSCGSFSDVQKLRCEEPRRNEEIRLSPFCEFGYSSVGNSCKGLLLDSFLAHAHNILVTILRYPDPRTRPVITGVGMISSLGNNRESMWKALRDGRSGIGTIKGVRTIPDDTMLAAQVNIEPEEPGELKAVTLARHAAREAFADAEINWDEVNRERFGCAISGHMADSTYMDEICGFAGRLPPNKVNWWEQVFPDTACVRIANEFGLWGPRAAHSTACASGLVSILNAVRNIRDGKADIALAGGGDAIDPLFASCFQQMRVLANDDDPQRACRPFDRSRKGFVLGEGGAMFVIESLEHAQNRNATIYAEILAGKSLSEAHHVTGLDSDGETLAKLIDLTLDEARLAPADVGYVNAHGTGTAQNDLVEIRGIRRGFGRAAHNLCVSATKSMTGHLINAAGCMELAITTLAMRDGYAPPTVNLRDPEPECIFDPLAGYGRRVKFEHAMKVSVAFGGHLLALLLRRWNDSASGFEYPDWQDELPLRIAA